MERSYAAPCDDAPVQFASRWNTVHLACAIMTVDDLPRSALADHLQMTPEDMSLSKRILLKPTGSPRGPGQAVSKVECLRHDTRFRHAPSKEPCCCR